jgi:hypothetical protein
LGNGHWQSAVYTLWDSTFAVGICLSLITFFHRFSGDQGRIGRFLSQQSYAAYIINIPIIVILAYALRKIVLGSARAVTLDYVEVKKRLWGSTEFTSKMGFQSFSDFE